jgi:hypothetical protein
VSEQAGSGPGPAGAAPRCLHCLDDGMVCEDHPAYPWEMLVEGHDGKACGGAGMPCPACCSPVPEDGTRSIAEAFIPDWQRAGEVPGEPSYPQRDP